MTELETTDDKAVAPEFISFQEACRYWFKLGWVSFGGPAGQIAMMHLELVEKRRWLTQQSFLHALNYCMLLPGPEAQQLATYIGWLMHGKLGGLVAGSLFVLPSFLILLSLGWIYLSFGQLGIMSGILYGIKPAVTAIVLAAAWRLSRKILSNIGLWGMAIAAFLAIFVWHTPFPLIVLSAALLGAGAGHFYPGKLNGGATHQQKVLPIITGQRQVPAHAIFRWRSFLGTIAVGLALWLASMAGLYGLYGWDGALTQMAWFFTKAALLTFGGAYAVLPYVYQGVVEHYQWLTANQMMDALALGETTPGPLVMVLTFVGCVAGWSQAVFGPEHLFLASAAAAILVTYFTFLPSFVFILAGGPLVESSQGNLKFGAALTGISAAVCGVIVNLAVFFAVPVFWPGHIDVFALTLGAGALLALIRFQAGVIKVILGCGLAGLGHWIAGAWLF
ncbi:chromate efflux transporter [Methylomonas paludis]|uniref:Chromate efflux transporter n=1 Tax=Methylomonas paludis TaxID=1173101 RepID=A0A975MMY0_9GAMM|nr:chromate efflux transporter [Methylomonas paludis]QWF70545.1 chromate efflux transporter [Methylomonas paludis]